MPLFAVHALDRPGALPMRLQHYPAHRAFIEADTEMGVNIILSGPLQSQDGETMIGSLFIIEAENQEAVTHFVHADPFALNAVWETISITRFHRRKG